MDKAEMGKLTSESDEYWRKFHIQFSKPWARAATKTQAARWERAEKARLTKKNYYWNETKSKQDIRHRWVYAPQYRIIAMQRWE